MNFLEFTCRMTGHLAWPVAVVAVVILFKDELRQVFRRIRIAKFGSAEFELNASIQQVKHSAESAGIAVAYDSSTFPRDSLSTLDEAPEWAFLQAWQEVERLLTDLYQPYHAGTTVMRAPLHRMVRVLVNEGILDPSLALVVTQLHKTRNRVVHESGSSITRGEALEWLGISKSVANRIRQMTPPTIASSPGA